ncbi:MAG: argininosuccinate lyase [bacterium]
MSPKSGKEGGGTSQGGKAWGGRFSQATDPTVERFSASIHFDKILASHDIRGSKAQARMLGRTGLISDAEAQELVAGLEQIAGEIADGSFPFDPALEDIHMNIETRLRTHLGPVAGKLHTGRSRNDQVATDLALFLRDIGRLAHHWLAHIEVLGRDADRFRDARARITRCPLGAGAMAGSTLPLLREETAAELGFEAPTRNSMDTVASRDLALEYMAAAAISMVHLSRLAEELVIWSSSEFGFVELADAYSTGSSLMPQKKNPDVPEIVRGKSGRVIGNLVTLLTVLKGLPLTYNRDLQEDKEPLFDTVDTLRDCLEVMAGAVATLDVKRERMAEAASDPMLLATDLAEFLVRKGVPFRDAHEVVGSIVGHVTRKHVNLRSLTKADMQSFHEAFDSGADELLDLERSLESRTLIGGTARVRVEAAIAEIESELAAERTELETLQAAAEASGGASPVSAS